QVVRVEVGEGVEFHGLMVAPPSSRRQERRSHRWAKSVAPTWRRSTWHRSYAGDTLRAAMTPSDRDIQRTGLAYGLGAFLFWGFAPRYFKAVAHVPAVELLAHRIVWAIPLLAAMVWLQRAWKRIDKRTLGMLLVSAALIGVNWLCYIIAINTDRVLEAALGYYINPLVS